MKDFTNQRPESFNYQGNWIDNDWMSNFTRCRIVHEGIEYPSVENFYQAMKTLNPELRKGVAQMSASHAKRWGRRTELRSDWEKMKVSIMLTGLALKFSQEPFKTQLINSNPDELIEWNNWGDRFWGVDISDNKGHNMLGECLKLVRLNLLTMEGLQQKLDI